MSSEKSAPWISSAGRRIIIVAALIPVVTLFWVALLIYTNLPTLAMAGIGLISLLLLSVATAWAAIAVPRQHPGADKT